jgi:hypothetical protein
MHVEDYQIQEVCEEAVWDQCEIIERPLRVTLRYGVPIWSGFIAHLRVAHVVLALGAQKTVDELRASYSRISPLMKRIRTRQGEPASLLGNVRMGKEARAARRRGGIGPRL